MSIVPINHIGLDDRGRAVVIGTTTRVSMIARDARAGLTAQDIASAYPYLNLSQVHAALSFYYENQSSIDGEIASEDAEIARLRADAAARGESFTQAQLEQRLAPRRAS
jgi:uncharacterized protein (DUF433 family)